MRLCPHDIQNSTKKYHIDLVVRKTIHGDTKTRAGVRLVRGQSELNSFEFETILSLKNQISSEARFTTNVGLLRNSWASRELVESSLVIKIIAQSLKIASGDLFLRPHNFRHGAVTRMLCDITKSVNPNMQKLRDASCQMMNITQNTADNFSDWKPKGVASLIGHKGCATSFKWYAHVRETYDNTDYALLNKIHDSTISSFLEIENNQYRQRRRRNETNRSKITHGAVYSYLNEDGLPSLISDKYDDYPTPKAFNLRRLHTKPGVLAIVEFLIALTNHEISPKELENSNHQIPLTIANRIRSLVKEYCKKNCLLEFLPSGFLLSLIHI